MIAGALTRSRHLVVRDNTVTKPRRERDDTVPRLYRGPSFGGGEEIVDSGSRIRLRKKF